MTAGLAAAPEAILPGIALALAMGLRHGLAPDHLAAIDALTMRAIAERPRLAPWMGACFAAGHAGAVMLIVIASARTSAWVAPYHAVAEWIELVPPVFLLVLAASNARRLLARAPPGDITCRRPAVPMGGRMASGPWSAAALGALFALGFESALQAVAWGAAAAARESIGPALLAAVAFTGGMAVTDGVDGWIAARIARGGAPRGMARFRRRLGWPIVGLCVVSALTLLAERFCAACGIEEEHGFAIGAAALAATVIAYGAAALAARREARAMAPGAADKPP
jgi:nickel/cobalt transporter (NiCoT) family protein